jgi:N6-L-threonylcarbamoyladenine synthase
MTILAIETSCDETSAAVIDGDRILSSVIWSQIKDHSRWGGVVPSIARRAHEDRLPEIVSKAVSASRLALSGINAIAVTVGPGLAPALEAGVAFAKKFSLENNKPLIPVNHLEGHIASLFLKRKSGLPLVNHSPAKQGPALQDNHFLSLIVSGGHTELCLSPSNPSNPSHLLLSQTLDDAAGEVLDKVGRELGLGYPAGSVVEQLARQGNPKKYKFPIPLQRSPRADLNFSFSGLKTAAIQMIHGSHHIEKARQRLPKKFSKAELYDFCASFQEAVIGALLFKLKRAIQLTGVKTVVLTGGVAANNRLRRRAGILVRSLGGNFYPAPKQFTGDNAAMIGLAAQWAYARGEVARTHEEISKIDRLPNLNFEPLRHSERANASRGI